MLGLLWLMHWLRPKVKLLLHLHPLNQMWFHVAPMSTSALVSQTALCRTSGDITKGFYFVHTYECWRESSLTLLLTDTHQKWVNPVYLPGYCREQMFLFHSSYKDPGQKANAAMNKAGVDTLFTGKWQGFLPESNASAGLHLDLQSTDCIYGLFSTW